MRNKLLLVTTIIALLIPSGIKAGEADLGGTEFGEGLTNKQLAIQRWFSQLTFLAPSDNRWSGWYYELHPEQTDTYSVRYPLTFFGYAAAALADRTPAYREVTQLQMDDLIQRMFEKKTWQYIEIYWASHPHFPDPVAFENVMYSGYLAQLLGLYEAVTGDYKYSEEGWDFVWDEKTKIHYTFEKLIKILSKQIEENDCGGIPCEPSSVFVICNNYVHNAFLLHDAIHQTNCAAISEKWRKWLEENFLLPQVEGKAYFKTNYISKTERWIAVGSPGNDGWTLAWMYPWKNNLEFLKTGWECLKNNKYLIEEEDDTAYYKVGRPGSFIFPIQTCYAPVVARQLEGKDSELANAFFNWFDIEYGSWTDLNKDGYKESYFYATPERTITTITSFLALAMVTAGDSMRNLVRHPSRKEFFLEVPYLAHVDYPNIYVRKARYKDGNLLFTVLKGEPSFSGKTELVCKNIPALNSITRNGEKYEGYQYEKEVLTITTDVDEEYNFVVKAK